MFDQKQLVLTFLKSQKHCVLATIDAEHQKPQAASVAFSETENLELIIGTFDDTRKFANILANPNVAIVVTVDDVTVQYEGTAHATDWADEEEARNTHLEKNPSAQKFAFHEKQRFIKVTPTWIRYTDYSVTPEIKFVIRF